MQYDTIVRGGTIVDGTMLPRYVDDIGIKDGRIVRIGGLRHSDAPRVIDASGLVVAPGFVDLHTHYDAQTPVGPILHHLGLAWGDLGGHRQLRIRLRSMQTGGPGPGDAMPDPQRGHPL